MRKKVGSVIIILCLQLAVIAQKVGLGTNTPIAMLDVRGSINADSVYRIKGGLTGTVLSIKGIQNTFVGIDANSIWSTPGKSNTATGLSSLAYGSDVTHSIFADSNTAIGERALYTNEVGDDNTACGYYASFNEVDRKNTSIGSIAMRGELYQSSTRNTAVGYQTLYLADKAVSNVAIGNRALQESPNAFGFYTNHNVALGYFAMNANTNDQYGVTTAIGAYSLIHGADYTVAVGGTALYNSNGGQENVAVGFQCLYNNYTARYNTALGSNAAVSHDIGYNNVIIGAESEVGYDGMYNGIALGNLAVATNNSVVRIGNSANWSYGGYANWTNISDGRFKKNIQEGVPGLSLIMGLRPVTYQLNATELNKQLVGKEPEEKMKVALTEKEKLIWTGFIAQDVDSITSQLNFDFSGLEKPGNEKDFYGLRYEEFVVPLIKAIQEQQEILQSLKKELIGLKAINHQLMEKGK